MRKYATQRLIAKDVPITLKGLFDGQNLRFRGRGSRVKAVETVMKSRALRNKYGTGRGSRVKAVEAVLGSRRLKNKYLGPDWRDWFSDTKTPKGLLYRFNQDLPLEFADRMSVYSRS